MLLYPGLDSELFKVILGEPLTIGGEASPLGRLHRRPPHWVLPHGGVGDAVHSGGRHKFQRATGGRTNNFNYTSCDVIVKERHRK